MKILQALFFPPEQPGGVSSMVPYIYEGFVKKGWSMEMFSLPKRIRGKGHEPVRFETFDWTVYVGHPVVDKYIQTYRDYLWWTRLRLSGPYDLIHAHHPLVALAMKQVFPDTPVLITIHSSYERELVLNGRIAPCGPEETFLTSLYWELEARTDGILTVSESFREYIGGFVNEPERIRVIPNGFDERRFRPIPHENAVPQLITVCRLVPAKGLDVLLQACAVLKRKGLPFVLHLIGDGPIRPDLERMAVDLGIYEDTIFYGYMLHPEEFMPFFDIFVLPSRAEAFGNVFAEAALCLLALVGTDVGGIAEQIEHGKNGLLVPKDDPEALAEALEKLIVDPDYRYALARAAREKAKTVYSLKRVIRQLADVYRSFATAETGRSANPDEGDVTDGSPAAERAGGRHGANEADGGSVPGAANGPDRREQAAGPFAVGEADGWHAIGPNRREHQSDPYAVGEADDRLAAGDADLPGMFGEDRLSREDEANGPGVARDMPAGRRRGSP